MKFPLAVVGSQWGDEGKGKIIDLLAAKADIIVRFNGGNNAGHTIIHNGEECKLHVLPSGIFHHKKLLITQGAVFDPEVLLTELEFCSIHKIKLDLLIDYRVNLVMPYHKMLDAATEAWKGKKATGSLHLGIGYCYEDRNNRSGIRSEDLLYPKILQEKIDTLFPLKKAIIEKAFGQKVDMTAEEIYKQTLFYANKLKKYVGDASVYLSSALKIKKSFDSLRSLRTNKIRQKRILFEGANGSMLDGNFGTYPYTVANNTISSSVFPYSGLTAQKLYTLGVVKAYTTRVGGGPFKTEQINEIGEKLQQIGKEVGTTSGRKRRCGWLDLNVIRYTSRLNGFDYLAITKLDVLSTFPEIQVCVAYNLNGKIIKEHPCISHDYANCVPIYKTFKGWNSDISKIRKFKELPKNAKIYLKYIEREVGVPIKIVSVGPKRNENILI